MNMTNQSYDLKRIENQENYIRQHKQHHRRVTLIRSLLLICFLGLWELASSLNWIDSFFFSSPRLILLSLWQMILDGSFFYNTGVTLLETLLSFLLVLLISVLSATVLWSSKGIFEVCDPYLVILNSLPKSALAPLFIVWLGTGITTIIVAGISVALFGSIISLYTGFRQIEEDKLKLVYTLGGTKYHAFTKVVLPGSIPVILSNMKVNIGLSLVGVIIGEFLAARRGLGYLIIYGTQVFKLNMVITSIIILCLIAALFYKIIQKLEHLNDRKVKQTPS